MGRYKTLILFGAAVVVALVTSVLVYTSLQKKMTKQEAPPPTESVAVAVVDLPWGAVIAREMVKMVPYLKENLPRGSFTDSAQLVGRVLVFPVKAGEPILESRLAPREIKTGGVAAVINPKKRAVAVKVDPVIGVAGFIHAGNRVDVLVTISPDRTKPPVTKTVLENILVLAAGAEIERKGKDPTPVNVITLEVTPQEAEKLALSATEGKLQLALRNFGDTDSVSTRGTSIPVLLASQSGEGAAPVKKASLRKGIQKAKPEPPKPAVEIREVEVKEVKEVKKEEAAAPSPAPAPAPVQPKIDPPVEKPVIHVIQLIKGTKLSEVQFAMEEEKP